MRADEGCGSEMGHGCWGKRGVKEKDVKNVSGRNVYD